MRPLWNLLGASWVSLGASWASWWLLGASWRLVEELSGASCDSSTFSEPYFGSMSRVLKKCLFPEQENDFQHLEVSGRPLGGFLEPLGALVGVLKHLGGVLNASWRALESHDGPLEGQMAEIMIFHWFCKRVPWGLEGD